MANNSVKDGKKTELTQSERSISEKYYLAHNSKEWLRVDDSIETPSSKDKEDYDIFLYDVYMALLANVDVFNKKQYDEDGGFIYSICRQDEGYPENSTVRFDKEEVAIIKESFDALSFTPLVKIIALDKQPLPLSVNPATDTERVMSNSVSFAPVDKPKTDNVDKLNNPQDSTIEIHDASGKLLGRIVDHGESLNPIVFASDQVAALETMRCAQSKGWSSVNLTGSDEFVKECMKYCVENNMIPIITQEKQQKMLDNALKKQKVNKKGLKM